MGDQNSLRVKINALRLLNLLIFKCPNDKKRSMFVARLENLGLYD